MDTPKAACIYCRLSYAPDGSVEKVERQEGDCRDLGARIDWPVCCVYSDNNKSAWQRDRKRPDWESMLTSLEPGAVCPNGRQHDGIIVYHGDRLIRQPWDLELLLKLADDRRIPLASPSGTRDLNNEDDRFILRIEAAQACRSSADTSRRVRRGWAARAAKGEPLGGGGKRPFGWGVPTGKTGRTGKPLYDVRQKVPDEFAVLRTAIDRLMAGETQGGVIAWMNTVCTTTEGNQWTTRGLRLLLESPRIAGLVEHEGAYHEAVWDGVVTVEEWEDLKSLLRRNGEAYGYPGRERKYLLTGAGGATCPKGHNVSTKPVGGRNRKTARIYYCPDLTCKPSVARNVEHLDAYVIGRVLRRLNEPDFIAAIHADTANPGLGAEIATLERRKAWAIVSLETLVDQPDVDPAVLARSLAGFDRKVAELRGRMAATTQNRLLARMAGITREQWDAEPVDVRAATVRALFRVTILPATWRGPGFDPKSVRVERR